MQTIDRASQLILEVTEVNLAILESNPPKLLIVAMGTVPSAGWSNPQLIPYAYIQAPPDGIYDFNFVATPPQELSAQVITPISVEYVLPAGGIAGVRIHASLNEKEILLNEVPCDSIR
jgi:hypothetical protein